MNWFVLANGIIYLGATWHSVMQGNHLWGLVWFCYAVSALAMFAMEPK